MTDLTIASDLLTLEGPSVISARTRSRASGYLPLSGRQAIRDKLLDMRRAVTDAMANAGLDMVVDVSDVRAEGELWQADDASWYWLASSNTNTIVLDENDVMRMHGITLERILDRESNEALRHQLGLSRLPPDPESNVAFERWHDQRVNNDIVWSYIRSHLPEQDKGAPHANGRRLNMALNSVTMYMYMVLFNPSAYGTHVRKLLRGAMQFAAHHVLARYHLGADTHTYVQNYVEEALRPYVKDILLKQGLETKLAALVEEHAEHGSAYERTKSAVIAILERTALVRDARTVLHENSVDTSTRDALFANLFSMYKLAMLVKSLATYVAETSAGAATETGALSEAAHALLADVERAGGMQAHAEMMRHARKLGHSIRAFGEVSGVVTPERDAEPPNLVAKRMEHAVLGLHALATLYAKFDLITRVAAVTVDPKKPAVAAHALATKEVVEARQEYKQIAATMKALASSAVRSLRAVRFTSRAEGSVQQAGAFFLMRVVAAREAFNRHKSKAPTLTALLPSAQPMFDALEQVQAEFDEKYAKAFKQYQATADGAESAKEPFRMNLADFNFGSPAVERRTENSVAMVAAFFLTGLLRTFHQVDKSVPVIVFKLLELRKPRSSPVEYARAIKALRDSLVKLIMALRDTVATQHAASTAKRVDTGILARSLANNAESVLQILLDRIYETPIGLAFACSASNIAGVGEFPTGASPAFTREWEQQDAKNLTADINTLGSALFESDVPGTSRLDLNRPYVYTAA
jgi:hypothetical protein